MERADAVRILLLEDSLLDAELVEAKLHGDGITSTLVRVQDRAEFVAALHSGLHDLILSDYNVPGFGGPEALELALATTPDVPFLFVSGAIGEEIAIESVTRGATDYVLKHRLERLAPAVRRALGERASREARRRVEAERDALLSAEKEARQAAERAAREQRLLADVSKILASSLRVEETLPRVAERIVPSAADTAFIVTLEDGRLGRTFAAPPDVAIDPRELVGPGVLERALDEGSAFHEARYLVTPLVTRQERFGVLVLASRTPGCALGATEIPVAEELARRIAAAIDSSRLFQEAESAQRRAEEASRSKDEFLAALSHELRTPLNAILGWAKMLRAGTLDPERQARALDVIDRNARIQTQLIADLLDVSRIISGKLRVELEDVELAGVVEMAIEALRPQAEAKGVTLDAVVAADAAIVRGDPDRLQQVAWNLLTNAVKFTPAGGRVEVTLREDGDAMELTVVDSGQGIEPEFLPHVFERFRQGEGGASRRQGGLGLGLSIVRHIVELHGGTVVAESEGTGRGARFVVRIPASMRGGIRPSIAAITRPSMPATLREVPRLDGVRVLVVDDERDARDLVVDLLRELGAEVACAGSAEEALACADRVRPHVVVSDIAMPGEDGHSLVRRLRARHDARTIALTAYASADDRARALEAGFDRHLGKPVEAVDLAVVITELISLRPRDGVDPRAAR